MGALILFVAALFWGCAFVAQKLGGDHLGPFAVTFSRNLAGGLFLLGVCAARRRSGVFNRKAVVGGFAGGAILFFASLTQQIGIADTTPGISAFLTSNYVLLVPVFGLFAGRKPTLLSFVWVAFALAGTYLLAIDNAQPGLTSIGRGEAWTLLCAVLFALQILAVDRFAPGTDIFAFSCVQQFTGMIFAMPFLMLASERAHYNMADISAAVWPVLFIGIFSSGIAYTCQNIGQTRCPPMLAAVIMTLESAIGALAGYVILGDAFTPRQMAGAGIMFATAILSQILEGGK